MTVDAQILSAFRRAGPDGVSGAELASHLGISRAAVWARIEELRSLGYDISASPHQGYRLLSSPDLLHADDLLARMSGDQIIGRDIRVFEETTSTNDVAEKLARDGVKEGVAVFAESQTKGRGRMGRRWVSPSKRGLWFSILLRPNLRPQACTQMTVAAATALVRAIERQTGLKPSIKWPNDILFNGRKAAGILTELAADSDSIRHLIVGIGLDVNVAQDEFPPEVRAVATSLRAELGRSIDRPALAAVLLEELDRDYARICRGDFPALADEWEQRCITVGQRVTVDLGVRQIEGRAESLDDDGALLLRTEHGRLERILGGDVTIAKR